MPEDLQDQGEKQAAAVRTLSALAQATRLRVFLALSGRSDGMASSEIADALGVSRAAMSSHLAVLAHAELVTIERRGKSRIYMARHAPMVILLQLLSPK